MDPLPIVFHRSLQRLWSWASQQTSERVRELTHHVVREDLEVRCGEMHSQVQREWARANYVTGFPAICATEGSWA